MGRLNATRPLTALLISSVPESIVVLERIFQLRNWHLETVGTYREAITFAMRVDVPVIVCEQNLQDGDWKDVLRDFDGLTLPASLIVTSRLADSTLWAEALNLGAYDVLVQPFAPDEVYRVVLLAWEHALASRRRFPPSNSPESQLPSRKVP